MTSSRLKALAMRLTPLSAMLACVACAAGPPVVTTQSAGCSQLLPGEWTAGVESAPLPDGSTVGDWIAFADAQTGRLDVANDRTKAAIEIVSRCEQRDREAVRQATRRRFLGVF